MPIGDVDAAVAEINRAVTQLGAVGVSPGSSRADMRLDHPRYEPIWAEAERLNVPLTFHGSFQVHLLDRYRDDGLMSHATGRGIEHPLSFMELLYSGVLERHPSLRCVFLEAGCSWLVYWLFRLEEEWEKYARADPELKQRAAGITTNHRPARWRQLAPPYNQRGDRRCKAEAGCVGSAYDSRRNLSPAH